MRTIYVIVAEKQYSSSKVLAAFDSEDAANKLKDTIEATEPRWTITVQAIELQRAPPKPFYIRTAQPPVVEWRSDLPADAEVTVGPVDVDAQGRSARLAGGPVKGTMMVGDGEPEVFIPSNSAAADKP